MSIDPLQLTGSYTVGASDANKITLRSTKGSPLDFNELDDNFASITEKINLLISADTADGISVDSSGNLELQATTASKSIELLPYGSSTPALVVDDNARVGIGTEAPLRELEINSTSADIRLADSDATSVSTVSATLEFGVGGQLDIGGTLTNPDTTDTFRSGWLGFDGDGDFKFKNLVASGDFVFEGGRMLAIGTMPMDNVGVRVDSTAGSGLYHFDEYSGSNTFGARMVGGANNDHIALYHKGQMSMAWKSAKIGIGTQDCDASDNAPNAARVHIAADIDVPYSPYDATQAGFETGDGWSAAGNNLLKLENLSEDPSAFAGIQFRTGNGGDCYFGAVQTDDTDGGFSQEADFYFANQNSPNVEMMRITSTGKVGIGTDDPDEMLHLKEDAPEIHLESSNATGNTYALKSTSTGYFHLENKSIEDEGDGREVYRPLTIHPSGGISLMDIPGQHQGAIWSEDSRPFRMAGNIDPVTGNGTGSTGKSIRTGYKFGTYNAADEFSLPATEGEGGGYRYNFTNLQSDISSWHGIASGQNDAGYRIGMYLRHFATGGGNGLKPGLDGTLAAQRGARSLSGAYQTSAGSYSNVSGELAQTISTGALVPSEIQLLSTTNFAASGKVKIGSEIFEYTSINGNKLTGVVRAKDGTSEAAHSIGEDVKYLASTGAPTGTIGESINFLYENYVSRDCTIENNYGLYQTTASGDSSSWTDKSQKLKQVENFFSSRTGIGGRARESKLRVNVNSTEMQWTNGAGDVQEHKLDGSSATIPMMAFEASLDGVERFAVDVADTRITNNTSQGTKLFLNNTYDASLSSPIGYDCNWQLHSDFNGEFKLGVLTGAGNVVNNRIIARTSASGGHLDVYDKMRVNASSPTAHSSLGAGWEFISEAAVDVRPNAAGNRYAYHITKPASSNTTLGGLMVRYNDEVHPVGHANAGQIVDTNNLSSELYLKDKDGNAKVTLTAKTNTYDNRVVGDYGDTPERLYVEDGNVVIDKGWLHFPDVSEGAKGMSANSGLRYVADFNSSGHNGSTCHMFFTDDSEKSGEFAKVTILKRGTIKVQNDDTSGDTCGLLVANPDTATTDEPTTSIKFGLSRETGALKSNSGVIEVGKEKRWSGTTDADVDSYMSFSLLAANNEVEAMRIASNGDVTVPGDLYADSWSSSDYRLKENIAPISGSSLDRVSKIKPASYTLKKTGRSTEGFIAHELEEVLPHAVRGEKDAVKTRTVKTPAKGEAYTPAVEGVEEVTEVRTTKVEKTELREVSRDVIEEVDGKLVKRTVVETINETVYEDVQVYGEDGKPEMVCTLPPSERVYEDQEVSVFEHDEDGNLIGERTEIQQVLVSEEREGCMEPLTQRVPVMIETTETVVVTEAVEAKAEEVVARDILESEAPEGTLWRETTPESVEEVEEIDAQSVDYSSIIPVLVGAIQELTAKVKELESA